MKYNMIMSDDHSLLEIRIHLQFYKEGISLGFMHKSRLI